MPKRVETKAELRAAYATDTAVAAYFGVNRATIWGWVNRNNFPSPVKLSPQMTRWRWVDVEAWEAAQAAAQRKPPHERPGSGYFRMAVQSPENSPAPPGIQEPR